MTRRCSRRSRSGVLDQDGNTLAATGAGRGYAIAPIAAFEFARQGQGAADTGCAQRMADGDGPSVDVDPAAVEPQLALHGDILGAERLVDLQAVDRTQRKPGLGQHGAD